MIRLLVLGTGSMARQHAAAFQEIDGVEIAAAADPSPENLSAFASEFDVEKSFGDLDDALAWGEFDAVANVTPDQFHFATTMALIEAGKHVLCEKPLATNYAHAREMADAAEARGVINHVNLTYRGSAATATARKMVADGAIGDLRHFDAAYLQSWLVGTHWGDWRSEARWLWRLSTEHGSHGVVGDIGVHIIDLTTFVAGQSIARVQGRTALFHKAPDDRIDEYGLDANDSFAMSAELDGGAVGVIHATRWASGHANDLRIDLFGDEGGLRLRTTGSTSSLQACLGDAVHTQAWEDILCEDPPSNYELFIDAIQNGPNDGASFDEAARVQRIMDVCLAAGEAGSAPVDLR